MSERERVRSGNRPRTQLRRDYYFWTRSVVVVAHTQIPYCRRKYNLFSGEPFSSIDSEWTIGVGAKIVKREEIKSQVALLH